MLYHLTDEFTDIEYEHGTIHNKSRSVSVEVSDGESEGILLAPQEKFKWTGGSPKVRAVGGNAVIAVVPFHELEKGGDGKSAYEIAVDNGFVGTEEEWLSALQYTSMSLDEAKAGAVEEDRVITPKILADVIKELTKGKQNSNEKIGSATHADSAGVATKIYAAPTMTSDVGAVRAGGAIVSMKEDKDGAIWSADTKDMRIACRTTSSDNVLKWYGYLKSELGYENNSYTYFGSMEWDACENSLTATTFIGNLSGKATKATGDKNGNDITTTYLPVAGGTVTGALAVNGNVSISANSYNQLRLKGGNYGLIFRNDGSNFHLLMTAQNDPDGSWTSARPLTINNSTGVCNINGNAATATKATGDKNGKDITTTYFSLTGNNIVKGLSFFNKDVWMRNNSHVRGNIPDTTQWWSLIFDSGADTTNTNGEIGGVWASVGADNNDTNVCLRCYKNTPAGTYATLGLRYLLDGTKYAYCPTPASSSNTNHIATTEWVRTTVPTLNSATATKLKTARTINIQDSSATNTGTGAGFDGSGNATIKLPATIKANITGNCSGSSGSCTGNAATATKLATARTLNIQDSSATNTGTGASFDGSGNATIKLPATIKASITGNCSGSSGSCTGNAATATTLKTARSINGVSFNGSAAVSIGAVCTTAAATQEKAVALTGFALTNYATITVLFRYKNTATNPTLNVNETGAKAIKYKNAAVSTGFTASDWSPVTLLYYNSAWHIINGGAVTS